MKKKILYILTTAVIILTAVYIGRNTAEPTTKVIHTMPEKVDLSNPKQFDYINTFLGSIIDWNTDGKELAIMTSAGYELYANKQETIYQSDIKAYLPLESIRDFSISNDVLEIITSDGNIYTFYRE